ncbi:lipid phosphate phosphatase delta-like protein [Tanacetum coccineum]
MTLLLAFCDYSGNCIKDVVSAPRPKSPPVRILTATKDEKENALEYGLPSSHTLNTICLSGYLLHYVISCHENIDASHQVAGFTFACLFVGLIGLGRKSISWRCIVVIDIWRSLVLGLTILAFWLNVHEYIDTFVTSGQNVTSFWVALSFLLLFAYPTPESPTPSFEFHTAFTGVALGIVTGVQQTYHQFHHENIARVFTPELTIPAFAGRVLIGIPSILLVKFCSKALAKWILPITASALGIPVRSSRYVAALDRSFWQLKSQMTSTGWSVYLQKCFLSRQESFDVDHRIRCLQYAVLLGSLVILFLHLYSQELSL